MTAPSLSNSAAVYSASARELCSYKKYSPVLLRVLPPKFFPSLGIRTSLFTVFVVLDDYSSLLVLSGFC